jgi:hypothetical protein
MMMCEASQRREGVINLDAREVIDATAALDDRRTRTALGRPRQEIVPIGL